MSILKCKICGGTLEVNENATTATCEYCGTEQTIPTVTDDVIRNLFNRANTLRLKLEFDKAEEIYNKIIETDNTQAEAYWGIILCKYGIEYVEDPKTFKRVPTCHRTSFDAITADEDYKLALQYADISQKNIYEAEAKAIDEIQKGILAICQNEKPYDVFICYKETDENGKRTTDSVIANDIYHQLTQEGFKVFYAAITLEDKLGQEYEPYIFAALNSAKVMLVVGSKPEYFTAVWVKNEWSRFMKLMKNDRSKLLIPCYKDMDAYELPEEFAHLQAQDMGKIGFINDVVRGIGKIITKDTAATAQTAVQQAVSGNSVNADNLLKRGFMELESKNWDKADSLFERVLDENVECGDAYLGKLLVKNRWPNTSVADEDIKNFYFSNYFSEDYDNIISRILKYGSEASRLFAGRLKEGITVSDLASELINASVEMPVLINDKNYLFRLVDEHYYDDDDYDDDGSDCVSIKNDDSNGIYFDNISIANQNLIVKRIELPKGITKAFLSFFYLKCDRAEVIIPGSLIDFSVGSKHINKINVSKNKKFVNDGGVIYNTDHTKLYFSPKNVRGAFEIPDSVTSIGDGAFYDCKNLTSVTIPDGVTCIGIDAFHSCESLTSVTIPDSVTSIGDGAFYDCKNLTSVTIPDGVTSIGEEAFANCHSLTSVTIPDSVTSIGKEAFANCHSLTSVTIPDSVTSIGEEAFADCHSLTSITIPDGVTSIGDRAFRGCESLTSVMIPDSLANAKYKWGIAQKTVIITHSEYIEKQRQEELRRKQEKEARQRQAQEAEKARQRQAQMAKYRAEGVCQHCGGTFKGLFTKSCAVCGKKKDY